MIWLFRSVCLSDRQIEKQSVRQRDRQIDRQLDTFTSKYNKTYITWNEWQQNNYLENIYTKKNNGKEEEEEVVQKQNQQIIKIKKKASKYDAKGKLNCARRTFFDNTF